MGMFVENNQIYFRLTIKFFQIISVALKNVLLFTAKFMNILEEKHEMNML